MSRYSKVELRELVTSAYQRHKGNADSMQGSENPQIREMGYRSSGAAAAFLSVLDYLENDACMLKIEAEGILS